MNEVNIRMCVSVDVCVCLMSLAGSLGLCRSEQVTPGWGERMKKTLKESGGLIWTALLCTGKLARLLSDKSKTHSTLSGLEYMQLAQTLRNKFALTPASVIRVARCQVASARCDSVRIFLLSSVALLPHEEDSLEKGSLNMTLWEPECVWVWEREHTLSKHMLLFLACDSSGPKINMY